MNDESLTEAAVLVPLFVREGEYHMVFTVRSNRVAYHKGQVSFPGGASSEADSCLSHTALREAWEEIGLEPADVEILGELDETPTMTSRFVISPIVAVIPYPYEFKPSRFEIDEIFDVPVAVLLREADVTRESAVVGGQVFTTYTYEYQGRVIWGATAQIVQQFLGVWESASGAQC